MPARLRERHRLSKGLHPRRGVKVGALVLIKSAFREGGREVITLRGEDQAHRENKGEARRGGHDENYSSIKLVEQKLALSRRR